MNVDIQTERIVMRTEWHRMIDEWVERCKEHHPDVVGIDVTLRHGGRPHAEEEVDAVATARGRSVRATTQAGLMTVALHDALDALKRELGTHHQRVSSDATRRSARAGSRGAA